MPQQPAPPKPHAPARGRAQPGEIRPIVRAVIDRMVELGEPWDVAANAMGMHARAMRKQLERPAVLQLLRRRRQVHREAASAGNIKRLVELRDQSVNLMASAKAIQLLEASDEPQRRHDVIASPGLVVIVEGARAAPSKPVTTIDATAEPVRERDDEPRDG